MWDKVSFQLQKSLKFQVKLILLVLLNLLCLWACRMLFETLVLLRTRHEVVPLLSIPQHLYRHVGWCLQRCALTHSQQEQLSSHLVSDMVAYSRLSS